MSSCAKDSFYSDGSFLTTHCPGIFCILMDLFCVEIFSSTLMPFNELNICESLNPAMPVRSTCHFNAKANVEERYYLSYIGRFDTSFDR